MMKNQKPIIAMIDGSLGGPEGNTRIAAEGLVSRLEEQAILEWLNLRESPSLEAITNTLKKADAFVFLTGTYWDSWGSPLQKFLEDTTHLESSDLWLGKPAAVLVTMHSVGGKEILSRLQGVLSTLGMLIPPMSGMVYSAANHLALNGKQNEFQADLWSLDDLDTIAGNLLIALENKNSSKRTEWLRWNVDRADAKRNWLLKS